jgi:hypothetical protein
MGFFLTLFVYMFSMGTIVSCDNTPYGCVDWNQRFRRFFGFAAFGMLWNCLFIVHFTQFLISSVAAHWYYNSPTRHPILLSVKNMVIYHLGSIAFGSIVLSIMSIFRVLIYLLCDYRLSKPKNNSSCIRRTCYSYLYCLTCTFERFLQYVTRNAYILMAIAG